jgi:hypothetical protein
MFNSGGGLRTREGREELRGKEIFSRDVMVGP